MSTQKQGPQPQGESNEPTMPPGAYCLGPIKKWEGWMGMLPLTGSLTLQGHLKKWQQEDKILFGGCRFLRQVSFDTCADPPSESLG